MEVREKTRFMEGGGEMRSRHDDGLPLFFTTLLFYYLNSDSEEVIFCVWRLRLHYTSVHGDGRFMGY